MSETFECPSRRGNHAKINWILWCSEKKSSRASTKLPYYPSSTMSLLFHHATTSLTGCVAYIPSFGATSWTRRVAWPKPVASPGARVGFRLRSTKACGSCPSSRFDSWPKTKVVEIVCDCHCTYRDRLWLSLHLYARDLNWKITKTKSKHGQTVNISTVNNALAQSRHRWRNDIAESLTRNNARRVGMRGNRRHIKPEAMQTTFCRAQEPARHRINSTDTRSERHTWPSSSTRTVIALCSGNHFTYPRRGCEMRMRRQINRPEREGETFAEWCVKSSVIYRQTWSVWLRQHWSTKSSMGVYSV